MNTDDLVGSAVLLDDVENVVIFRLAFVVALELDIFLQFTRFFAFWTLVDFG